jgi:hypothetical protein
MSLPRSSRFKLPLCSAALALFAVTSLPAFSQSDATITPVTAPINASAAPLTSLPRLVKFSGSLPDSAGSTVTLHFALYSEQTGGDPLWSESQSVTLTEAGKYSVLLGITTDPGLPQQLFTTGSAKWLGVKQGEGEEAPRTLLLAAPYAFKSSDADTLAGHPVTDFALLNGQPSTGRPETGTAITQINVGAGLTGGGTGPTVTIAAGANVLTSLTGSNGLQVTQSGHAYYVTAGPGLITLGNTYFAQLKASNTFTQSQAFEGQVNASDFVINYADKPGYYLFEAINSDATSGAGIIAEGAVAAVVGEATATSGQSIGVYGGTASTSGFGVQGGSLAGTSVAVNGQVGSLSSTGETLQSYGYESGVWGDAGGTSSAVYGFGVLGTGDAYAFGGLFANNDPTGVFQSLGAINYSTNSNSYVFQALNNNPQTFCNINYSGDLYCDGSITASVPTKDNRRIQTYSVQSSENWIEDFGSGQLQNGRATISLDPTFAKTVNTGLDYHVFLTPNGDSKGLYVTAKGPGSFEVRESNGGASTITFDYRIVAKRLGSENVRLKDMTAEHKRLVEATPHLRPGSKPVHRPAFQQPRLPSDRTASLATPKK